MVVNCVIRYILWLRLGVQIYACACITALYTITYIHLSIFLLHRFTSNNHFKLLNKLKFISIEVSKDRILHPVMIGSYKNSFILVNERVRTYTSEYTLMFLLSDVLHVYF